MALKYLIRVGCQNPRLTVQFLLSTSIFLLHWTINLQTSIPVNTIYYNTLAVIGFVSCHCVITVTLPWLPPYRITTPSNVSQLPFLIACCLLVYHMTAYDGKILPQLLALLLKGWPDFLVTIQLWVEQGTLCDF